MLYTFLEICIPFFEYKSGFKVIHGIEYTEASLTTRDNKASHFAYKILRTSMSL